MGRLMKESARRFVLLGEDLGGRFAEAQPYNADTLRVAAADHTALESLHERSGLPLKPA
ncbi:hypothetical protein [Streptomyces sp. RG80]|uniref:hypothetical protein n=1 Tax=Streptomyces sp. RG80 TaxID=3157340 RepID=UPI00338F5810